jgi:predicted methyltransferase
MRLITAIVCWALLALPAQGATIAEAIADPQRSKADRERDQREQPAVILELLNIGEGSRVADIFAGGGYYSELIGRVVSPGGEVLLHNNQPYLKYVGEALDKRLVGREVPGVVRHDREPADLDLGENSLDAALIIMSYHDLYYAEEAWPAIDVDDFMQQIVRALKPGGRFLIVDHAAKAGTKASVSQTLHRIEEPYARAEIERQGLRYVGGTEVLRNPADARDTFVFDPQVKGTTDRFVQVFEKPAQ